MPVERRQPLLGDPGVVRLGEVRERDVVPEREREPVVLVLDGEAPAKPGRQLVDEAEDAVVRTGPDPVRSDREADGLRPPARKRGRNRPPVALEAPLARALVVKRAERVRDVDPVPDRRPADRDQVVARTDPRPGRLGTRCDLEDSPGGRTGT
jgi:hypothetical protein